MSATRRWLAVALVVAWGTLAALGLLRWVDGNRAVHTTGQVGWLSTRVGNYHTLARGWPMINGGGEGGKFRLVSEYPPDWPEGKYLATAFPDVPPYSGPPAELDPNQTLHLMLTLAETGSFPPSPPPRLLDSWGTPYRVTADPGFEIVSAGPDKTFGTPDDISSRDKVAAD